MLNKLRYGWYEQRSTVILQPFTVNAHVRCVVWGMIHSSERHIWSSRQSLRNIPAESLPGGPSSSSYELPVCVCASQEHKPPVYMTLMTSVNQPEAFYYLSVSFPFFVQGVAGGNGKAVGLCSSCQRGHVGSWHSKLLRAVPELLCPRS